MLLQPWLNLVCNMLPNVTGAVLVLQKKDGEIDSTPAASWPASSIDDAHLLDAVPLASKRLSPVFNIQNRTVNGQSSPSMLVAFPLLINEQLFAIIAIELEAKSTQQGIVSKLLQWSNTWLQLLLDSKQEVNSDSQCLKILSDNLKTDSLQEAITTTASHLANQFECERVSIGLFTGKNIQIKGISHHTLFDRRQNIIQLIEKAMGEAYSQQKSIVFPSITLNAEPAQDTHTLAHKQLSHESSHASIYTVPLFHNSEPIGVVTFERQQTPFSPTELKNCKYATTIITSLIIIKSEKTSSFDNLKQTAKEKGRHLTEPDHKTFKIAALAFLFIALLLSFGNAQYRVHAQASLEGSIQRVVTAPFDGYIAKSYARAGENIKMGEPIAELDAREIKLEVQRWASQRDELVKQYRQALSEMDYVQVKIYKAQITQTEAQIKLLNDNIKRALLSAPLNGIIISGDLSRTLGAPVERGQVLFEVAPLDEYRLVLMIDERDIKDLAVGQKGSLSLSALPNEIIQFKIERIATEFQEQKDRVVYRTEASLDSNINLLRPGMQGLGKIDIEQRKIGWILFHRLLHWARFELWSWLP